MVFRLFSRALWTLTLHKLFNRTSNNRVYYITIRGKPALITIIWDTITINVRITRIARPIKVPVRLVDIQSELALVLIIQNTVVVIIWITYISLAVTSRIFL